MDTEQFRQGIRNIEDAHFVRDKFLPIAVKHSYWNIAVYEAQRATELLLKGMINLIGQGQKISRKGHTTEVLADILNKHLSEIDTVLPFAMGAYNSDGNAYGVIIESGKVSLLERTHNSYTVLMSGIRIDEIPRRTELDIAIEVGNDLITLILNDVRFQHTDNSISRPIRIVIKRKILQQPEPKKLRVLKNAAKRLRKRRNTALYGEKEYSEQDASDAISDMKLAFEAAKIFFERVQAT